ncbi:MAG: glucuronoarabinoxylan endo-1,4-beta-xylanase, partial [Lachnospiraceae bacterium]|nr:glucuronoarabinoxylan endo-1,4-beta-xylanase [Lachnospiraceae bacterium]
MLHVKAKCKSILALVLALAIVFSSFAAVPATKVAAADTVTVNLNKTYQTIRGFGGINLPEWAGSDMTTSQVNRAFGNGTYDLGLSILRIYVSDDRNQWYKALATAKTAIANGAIVFATPWNPPASMSETFTRTYTEWNGQVKTQYNQKRLRRDKYGAYAQHLNDFVSYMKNNGVDLYAISMANEPDYGHDWTWWTSDECASFLANYAGQINCRVISPESFSYNKEYYNKILNNSAAYNNTDIFGTHFYGTSRNNMNFPALESCGKEIWMTEVYVPNSDANSANRWPEAIQVSENIHNGLVVGNMNAYVWWYIRRSYGPMTEDGNISKRGYCMAQYSKFVRPGYVRVDATEIPTNGVYVSAYKGNNQAVIVAVNTGSTGYAQNFSISGNTIKKVDRYRTSSNENLALTSNLECSSNGFWATLPANSVSTFVVSLNGSTGSNNN